VVDRAQVIDRAPLQPVAVQELVAKTARPKPGPKRLEPLAVGPSGILTTRVPLPCEFWQFAITGCPFIWPCVCGIRSSTLHFDDNLRELRVVTWRGLFCCCTRPRVELTISPNPRPCQNRCDIAGVCPCTTTREIPYADIGNVALRDSGLGGKNSTSDEALLVLKDGEILRLGIVSGAPECCCECCAGPTPEKWALSHHRFLFGRDNPSYVEPSVSRWGGSLRIVPDEHPSACSACWGPC